MRLAWRVALGGVGVIALMLVAAVSVDVMFPADWRAVDATVTAARIEQVRPGTVQWAVLVDVRYSVDGRDYEGHGIDMARNAERAVTEAALADWPAGRTVRLYYDAAVPERVSRWADGGRQALAVLAALMVPVLLALGFFVAALVRRRRAVEGEAP